MGSGGGIGAAAGRGVSSRTIFGVAAVVVAPIAVVVAVVGVPRLDARWENHPAHFWLVLGAAGVSTVLGYGVAVAARRRNDARLFFISLAFVASSAFLGLHALATPGVLLGPNAGFELATPVGLLVAGWLMALSTREFSPQQSTAVLARSSALLSVLAAIVAVWGVASLARLAPLDAPLAAEELNGWQAVLAALGAVGYGAAAAAYLRVYRRRGEPLVLAVIVALALLVEAMVVIALARNWRVSWWEWHVLMLLAFATIAIAARREWHEERFEALYLDETLAGLRDASVLFADMAGYTSFTERHDPAVVVEMLNTYFAELVPLMQHHGGEVHQIIGDALMVIFNKQGDQPDHAVRAARAGLALQEAASSIADAHPGWPRFRVGINSGQAVAGVLGHRGHRKHGLVGDVVNLASRLESQAPAGGVLIGEGTYERLPAGTDVEPTPPLQVKGKSAAVTAYVLRSLGAVDHD